MADTGRLDELKRKFDENPRRYFAPLANEYRKAGEFDEAIELCRAYLPHQPGHMSGYIVYGQSLFDAGRGHEAAEIFQQALHLDPENIIALRHLGDIARIDGNKALAMQWYGRVLDLDPKNEEITAYITGLATPGAVPVQERQAPPTIRPEPEPVADPVALADLVDEPDTHQTPFEIVAVGPSSTSNERDEPPAEHRSATVEHMFDVLPPEEPLITNYLIDRSKEKFELVADGEIEAPLAGINPAPADDLDPVDEIVLPQLTEAQASENLQAMEAGLSSEISMESNAWAAAEELSQSAAPDAEENEVSQPVPTAQDTELYPPPYSVQHIRDEDAARESTEHEPHDAVHAHTSPVADDAAVSSNVELEPSTDLGAPFITETMATLYLQQGFTAEALDVYRKLASTRDEPRLHEKVQELELLVVQAANARDADELVETVSRETVREFFARIGARRPDPHDVVTLAASAPVDAPVDAPVPAAPQGLSALFPASQLDEHDVRAAAALSGAFSPAR